MKQFTFSDMNRASGEILEAALVEPVTLTKRGKDKLVILTAEQYRKLIGRSHTAAYDLMDAPEDIHQELMTGLEDIIEADNA
jgi:prevent-host-death family protein